MSLKTSTNQVLHEQYQQYGLSYTVSLATAIIGRENARKRIKGSHDRSVISGEICETVLELAIKDFMNLNPEKTRDWHYVKGLVLKDTKNPNSEYLTEIDFVLFTERRIYLFECKSYKGDKVLTGEGTIKRKGEKDFDVYKQHSKHASVFLGNFKAFFDEDVLTTTCHYLDDDRNTPSACKLVSFLFAAGTVQDKRKGEWKYNFPFVELDRLFHLMLEDEKLQPCWNLKQTREVVTIIEKHKEAYTRKHLAYVTNLHRGKRR